jgi:putative oxidoreductase
MRFAALTRFRDFGLLVLRFGIGVMFMLHGLPKITGGPDRWAKLGAKMSLIGIDSFPHIWGFLAAVSEFAGGFLLILGFFFRPALVMLFFTMVVAVWSHVDAGDAFTKWSHAAELGILFFALIFIGPGRYSLDEPGGRS